MKRANSPSVSDEEELGRSSSSLSSSRKYARNATEEEDDDIIVYENYRVENDGDITQTSNGSLLFNPYNPLNKRISLEEVQSILVRFGLPPTVYNLAIYQRAFVHRSYTKRPKWENLRENIVIAEKPPDCLPLSTKSNERMEYLGDGALEFVTKYLIYRRFPKANEGFMTTMKIAAVKNKAIGKIALDMGLAQWLILSRHAEESGVRSNVERLGALFESFVGAVFLDFNKHSLPEEDAGGLEWPMQASGPGFQYVQIFIERVFAEFVDWTELLQHDDNYKNILQVMIQKEFKVTPVYYILEESRRVGYRMGVYLHMECSAQNPDKLVVTCQTQMPTMQAMDITQFGSFQEVHQLLKKQRRVFVFLGEGIHKIKREAEQLACRMAIERMGMFS